MARGFRPAPVPRVSAGQRTTPALLVAIGIDSRSRSAPKN
jgi:hypothetical protein